MPALKNLALCAGLFAFAQAQFDLSGITDLVTSGSDPDTAEYLKYAMDSLSMSNDQKKAACKGEYAEVMDLGFCITYEGEAYKKDGDKYVKIANAADCPGGCAQDKLCHTEETKVVCDEYRPSSMGVILAIVGVLIAIAVGILIYCFCCKSKGDSDNNYQAA